MNYNIFISELLDQLEKLSIPRSSCELSSSVKNNSVTIRTLIIKKEGVGIAPCVNMEKYYSEWDEGRSIESIANELKRISNEKPPVSENITDFTWEQVKSYVIYSIVNYESNLQFLEKTPHIRILDLVLIFRLDASFLNVSGLITINNNLLKQLNVNKSALFTAAYYNTPRLLPMVFIRFNDLVDFNELGIERIDALQDTIWLVTNSEKHYGASAIFYEALDQRLEELDFGNCFVLPSSVHETIIVKEDGGYTKEALASIVSEVNDTSAMDPSDILSNTVYDYEELKKAFSLIKKTYLSVNLANE